MVLRGFELHVVGGLRSSGISLLIVVMTLVASSLLPSSAAAQEPGTEKWRVDRGARRITGSPVIAPDGTILYFEAHETDPWSGAGYTELVAVYPDGSVRWTKNLTGLPSPRFNSKSVSTSRSNASPIVGADGTIYVALNLGYNQLQAIDLDGNELWRTDEPYGVSGQPAIGADGTIYVGRHAFYPDGELKWETLYSANAPAIAADGTIYYANLNGVWAVDPEGNLLWSNPIRCEVDISLGLDGTIYGADYQSLWALNPEDGSIRWELESYYSLAGGVVLGPDGTLYISSTAPCDLHAFDPSGNPLWQFPLWNGCESSYGAPTVARNGTILWSTINHLVSVWPDGSSRWNFEMPNLGGHSTPAIGEDGTVYIGSTEGVFYAVHDDNGGLAPSPWPTYQHDVARRGSSSIRMIPLVENEPYNAAISPRGADFFSFAATPGQSLLIEVEPVSGIDSLTLSAQAAHDHFKTDSLTPAGTYELLKAPTTGDTYYLTVYGEEIDTGGGSYNITARYVSHHLSDLLPRWAGNAGEVSLRIRGLGFEEGMQVQLEGAESLAPMAVEVDSEIELLAQFDLTGVTVGLYDLRVIWPDMTTETFADAFEVRPGFGPRLKAGLVAPEFIRPDRRNVLWLEYSNIGDANLPAPLFSIRSNVLVSLDSSLIVGQEVEVLGVGGTSQPEILTPGEERRIPVYFIGLWGPHSADFELLLTSDDGAYVNWADYKDEMRPADIDPSAWDALWPDLVERLGDTWGEYKETLRGAAAHLAPHGVPVHDVGRLISWVFRLTQGNPEEIISGTLRHRDTFEPLVGVTIRARNLDGLSIRQVETSAERPGFFLLDGLEEGTYEIWVDDYMLDPATVLAVGFDDTAGLELFAVDRVASEEAPSPVLPAEHSPSIGLDSTNFKLLAVWHADEQIWWARNSNYGWDLMGTIPGAEGSRPVAVWDAGLLNNGTAPGWFVAWESADSPRRILWSTGVDTGSAIAWSTPQPLTGDLFTDTGIAVTSDLNHDPIVLWLQRDLEIADDSDLYWTFPDLSVVAKEASDKILFDDVVKSFSQCSSLNFGQFYGLSRQVPVIGGDYGFNLTGELCAMENQCLLLRQGSLQTKVKLSDFLSLSGGFAGEFKFQPQAGSDCLTNYVFVEGKLTIGLSGTGSPFIVVIPIPAIGGQARIHAAISASAAGEMTWKSLPPGLPDEGGFSFSLGVAPTVEIEALGGVASGSASGSGEVFGKHMSPPPNPAGCVFARDHFCVEKYCWALAGRLEALWGILGVSWKKEWCEPTQSPRPLAPFSKRLRDDEFVVETYHPKTTEEDVPVYEEVVYAKEAHTGTGAIYEGLPVLADVDLDLLNDGAPSVARSPAGEILAVWTKDEPADSLGARVHASVWTGAGWDTPVQLTPAVDLVKDPSIVFDSTGSPMVIWSQASNAGLNFSDPAATLIPALLAATEEADIFYSRRVGDVWTAPALLASIPGRDEQTALAAGPSGQLAAAWLSESATGWTVYAALWDGSSWAAPEAVATPLQAEKPALRYTYFGPVLAWAQDTDGDTETAHDWKIFWSELIWSGWSDPVPILDENSPVVSKFKSFGSGFWNPGAPPEECCSGGSVDPPSPPGGSAASASSEYVYGWDPNEKTGTQGVEPEGYIQAGDQLTYTVYFENLPAAPAPAQEVFVTDCLPPELDWNTLRIHEVAFGDVIVANSEEGALLSDRVTIPDYRGDPGSWWVDIESELDLMFDPGCFKVTLRTLDPATGELPMDPFAGFLPPEDGTGRGQGHIGLTIDTLSDLPDGTQIVNQASIVFDTNAPIVTNEFLNTVGTPGGFYTLTVNRSGAGSGAVTSDPSGIDCGNDCSEFYPASTEITLTPEPDPGSVFKKWLGDADCSDAEISLIGNVTCTAVFEGVSVFFDGFESGNASSWSRMVQ